MQGVATQKYFSDQNLRPFIISRSTFAGQGKFTSHWLGDNFSRYEYIKYSISGILSMNVFGINFVGADICGFLEISDEKLCQVWTNVGAFYPFARNHNDINDKRGQEPYVWSPAAQATMRNALRWRYAVLRYYYTQMYLTSTQGGAFWKPLFFEYPNENHAYDDIERNIMIGPALKFSPMIHNSTSTTESFILPSGKWCNIIDYSCVSNSKMQDVSLPTTPDKLNLHLRPGYIIPLQRNAVSTSSNTTVDLENMEMGLILNPTDVNKATGMFFADDGKTINSTNLTLIKIDFTYDGKNHAEMTFTNQFNGYTSAYTKLKSIEIMGANYSNLYKLTKMSIEGGTVIKGTFDSNKRLLKFTVDTSVEMTQITKITFDA